MTLPHTSSPRRAPGERRPPPRLPKLVGADIEVGNFLDGHDRMLGTGFEASRALLREVEGLPGTEPENDDSSAISRDWGRKFLPSNGGCIYVDLNHIELCIPEVLSARDWTAAFHAMLAILRTAQSRANRKLAPDGRIHVLVNNSDGEDSSYGSHLNVLVTRRCWENIFHERIHHLLFLAAYQVSSIVFTGQGKVGAENGARPVPFQISQRADFFERLVGPQTTYARPIVNSRDESLCGSPWDGHAVDHRARRTMARLHVIFYDSTLSHVSNLLKIGVLQIILAMIEAERVNPGLVLEHPLEALRRWSHDPELTTRCETWSGLHLSAVELQLKFLEEARAFVEKGGCEGVVPHAAEILELWGDTLDRLEARDFPALTGRLDWVLKRSILEAVLRDRPDLDWSSPEIKHLDHVFSSLDLDDGIFWGCERTVMERLVSEDEIARFVVSPPPDTRAWARAMLLRKGGPDRVDHVDWDQIRFRCAPGEDGGRRTIDLASPLGFTREMLAPILERGSDLDETLDDLRRLAALRITDSRR